MKTVAQTVIEADRFYTIAARTGSVIEAAASTKNEETVRLGKYDHKPEQEWGVHPRRGRCLPHPQPRFRQAPRPDDDRHRQRHLAASVGGCGRHVPDVDRGAYPRRHRPPALFLGQRQVHRHRGHGRLRWRTAADLAGDRWGRPALDHLRGEGPRQRKARCQKDEPAAAPIEEKVEVKAEEKPVEAAPVVEAPKAEEVKAEPVKTEEKPAEAAPAVEEPKAEEVKAEPAKVEAKPAEKAAPAAVKAPVKKPAGRKTSRAARKKAAAKK